MLGYNGIIYMGISGNQGGVSLSNGLFSPNSYGF